MTTKHPRVLVGNGKYCYTGPNCKLHGTVAAVITEMKTTHETSSKKFLDTIHENNISVNTVDELGDKVLLVGQAAHWCEEHKIYHIYPTNQATLPAARIAAGLFSTVSELVKNGELTKEQSVSLYQQIRANAEAAPFLKVYANDKKTYIRLQKEWAENLTDSEAYFEAVDAREDQRAASREESTRFVGKPEEPVVPLMLQADKVSDAAVLEYWQCGRKRPFVDVSEADGFLKNSIKKNDMSAYKCSHCPEWHIGHGGGLDSVESQVVRGRVHWNENPNKSNLFAVNKKLV